VPRLVALALLAGRPDAFAQADQPALRVDLRESGSQRVLRGARCALIRGEPGTAYACFDAPEYRGPEKVRAGDRLLVYRRGSDVAHVPIDPGRPSVTVTLAPASRPCVIEIQGAGKEDPRFHLVWSVVTGFGVRDRYRTEGAGSRVQERVSRGARVDVTVEGRGIVAWPRRAPVPDDGSPVLVRLDAPWKPTLRLPRGDDGTPLRARVDFLPDLLFEPPGPAARVDAWRAAIHRPWWGLGGPLTDGHPVRLAPAVPIHVVATIGERTVVRRVGPPDATIDLRSAPGERSLSSWPLLDGRPAPSGAVVLPGRLDTVSVAAFLDLASAHPGLSARVPAAAGSRAPVAVRLPASDWLTVWHPEYGLAHVRWERDAVPRGSFYPGSMTIRAPRGWRLEGTVAAYPVWRGTGSLRTVPPDSNLRREVSGSASVRIRGLRPVWHAFDLHLDMVHATSGRRHRIDFIHEAPLTPEQPHRRYDLRAPADEASSNPNGNARDAER